MAQCECMMTTIYVEEYKNAKRDGKNPNLLDYMKRRQCSNEATEKYTYTEPYLKKVYGNKSLNLCKDCYNIAQVEDDIERDL